MRTVTVYFPNGNIETHTEANPDVEKIRIMDSEYQVFGFTVTYVDGNECDYYNLPFTVYNIKK